MPEWRVHFNVRISTANPEMISCLAYIHAVASVITGIPLPPAIQDWIDKLNILRAVRGTTGIEGSDLTEEEVRAVLDAAGSKRVLPPNRQREEQEAINAENVMRYAANCRDKHVTESLVQKIHELTTQDINYQSNIPGKYRTHGVHAGSYSPPKTGEEVERLMRQFVSWFNEGPPRHWDLVIRAIVAHFYVVSIHPFGDGNGRTARGVESFVLYRGGINARGFYSLANHYYQQRDEYVRLLDSVRFETAGDLTPFVSFALRGLQSELELVHEDIMAEVRVIAFRDFARERLLKTGKLGTKSGERIFHFLLALGWEPVSPAQLRSGEHPLSYLYRHVSTKTIQRDLKYLLESDLIILDDNGDIGRNLEIMTKYTVPLQVPKPSGRRRASPRPRATPATARGRTTGRQEPRSVRATA